MGNSNITLQQIVDGVSTIGDLNPVLVSTGGFASEPALTISNDVAGDMFSERFPWKWNRMKIKPFILIPWQQDYASLTQRNIGWLENGFRVQLNSTAVPPPVWPIQAVRDLPVSRVGAGWPAQACWFPDDQLEQGVWPGPLVVFTDPQTWTQNTRNPWINILDADGNILVLTKWGTTGLVPPVAPPWPDPSGPPPDNYPVGVVITDGTCQWTVADPYAQGFRLYPPPGDVSASTWLIRLFAQTKAPFFSSLQQKIDPIPDDYSKWFRDGFVAYAHRYSAVPAVKARFAQMKNDWLTAMGQAARQGDREDESKGFFPDKGLLSPEYYTDPGPGNPYWRQWGGS
jgi:hypothetical protein